MQSLPMESLQKMNSFSVIHSYCNNFLPPVSSKIFICWIAILLSLISRSDCGIPSLMKTALRFSIFDRQMSSLQIHYYLLLSKGGRIRFLYLLDYPMTDFHQVSWLLFLYSITSSFFRN